MPQPNEIEFLKLPSLTKHAKNKETPQEQTQQSPPHFVWRTKPTIMELETQQELPQRNIKKEIP